MVIGCVLAIAIDNMFLIPVFALAFAMIPFGYAKRTIGYYESHIQEDLETALSIVTTSYIRNDDIVTAFKENLEHLKPPVKDIFAGFIAENMMISANIKQSLKHLKEKVNNSIFREWCDTLIACQDDRTLKDTLMPIVGKLTDVRLANGEIKAMLGAARIEYYMMAGMVVANIPLLYILNKDWYNALMLTTLGKIILAVCGMAILVTFIFMTKFTKPIEYRK
jgi:Flp pilus assembly protein TadB